MFETKSVERVKDSKAFGDVIRSKRKKLGITQGELAKMANVSIMFVSMLERGKQTAELGKALELMNTLGVDLSAKERAVKTTPVSQDDQMTLFF